jgi:DNA uptake protein ComE-like DNA-binding protein
MRCRRGSAFILALAGLVVLTMVLATAGADAALDARAQGQALDAVRAKRLAESGVQYALAQLAAVDTATVTLDDAWAAVGDGGSQYIRVGRGGFRVQILDASGRVDLNSADEQQLQALALTTEQIESLLDWREADLQPRPEGAKDEYYNLLQFPYNARLGRFETVDELLLVKGFDAATLFEPPAGTSGLLLGTGSTEDTPPLYELLATGAGSPNVNPEGQPKSNVNVATVQQLVQAGLGNQLATAIVNRRNTVGTFVSWASLLQTPGINQQNVGDVLDACTLDATDRGLGRMNLNTASEAALRTVPGLEDDVVQAILSLQGTFSSLSSLVAVPGVTLQLLGQVAGRFTTGSDTFVVRCLGIFGSRDYAVEAYVRMVDGVPRVTTMSRYPYADAAARWGWETEQTTESVLVEER